MKILYVLSCVLLCSSCSVIRPVKIAGKYNSTCLLYGYPDLEVSINSNCTFIYKMPYVEDIAGTWIARKDTLILYSDKFTNDPPSESAPAYKYNKYTDLEGKDAFIVKGRKLYPINQDGYTKGCYLQKE